MDVDGAMGIHFQEEIIVEILARLPVRSLLRFKCVSTFWMTLISEPYFMMKHLKNNRNSQKLLVSQRYPHKDEHSLYSSPLSSVQRIEEVQKLEWPSNGKPCRCRLYCSYDNLVVLGVSDYPDNNHHRVLLWNPSTRESIVLPPDVGDLWTWGLGYDSTSDDYKILKIDHLSRGEILALKSGSWRLTDEHPRTDFDQDSLVFIHEAFHWLDPSLNNCVVSFSISNEIYKEIPLLEQIYSRWCVHGASVLGGMLCVYSHDESNIFKMWVMKEYGIKESWTELFSIQDTGLCSIVPKYRFSDGEVLLCCIHSIDHSYVFMTSKGPFGLWPQSDVIQKGFVFTESLFFPKVN